MFTRAGRAAILDRKAFTEAFFDGDAAADGAIIVALVGAATYLGTLLRLGAFDFFSIARLFQSVIAAVISWLILALVGGLGLIWYLVILVLATQEAAELKIKDAAVSVLIGFAAAALLRALIGVPFAVFGSLFG